MHIYIYMQQKYMYIYIYIYTYASEPCVADPPWQPSRRLIPVEVQFAPAPSRAMHPGAVPIQPAIHAHTHMHAIHAHTYTDV